MSDIFISYASADRDRAHHFATALKALGWSVWWDREIPHGKSFDQVIEEQVNAARCVIVLWSAAAVRSRWVKTEAASAADRERLIPVRIDDVPIPLEFKRIQTATLQNWQGEREDPEFVRLLNSIKGMLGEPELANTQVSRGPSDVKPPTPWRKQLALGTGGALLLTVAFLLTKMDFRGSKAPEGAPADQSQQPAPAEATTAQSQQATPTSAATSAGATRSGVDAPAKGAFPIKIGDKIEDNVPAPGAGRIETAGAKDVYTFTAAAGSRVYFRMVERGKDMSQIRWELEDPDGKEVFDSIFGIGDPGVQVLEKEGTYVLTVGSDKDPSTGTYRLQLLAVPEPSEFRVKLGDKIEDNVPAPGAGRIETAGAKDIYTFTAAAASRVYFRMIERGKDMSHIRWKLRDPDDKELFDNSLGIGDPGVQVLEKEGTYVLTVGSDTEPSTGTYRLALVAVPESSKFRVRIGDKIEDNVPAPGAGRIETAGAKDVYTFTAAAGSRVYFRMVERGKDMSYIRWKLQDPGGKQVFDNILGVGDPGVQVLEKEGTYVLTVGSDTDPSTGTYRLQLSNADGP